jgi:hypothetical protein
MIGFADNSGRGDVRARPAAVDWCEGRRLADELGAAPRLPGRDRRDTLAPFS